MKKYAEKIIVWSILTLIFAAIVFVGYMAPKALAADANMAAAHSNLLAGSYTNLYVVFVDADPESATIGMIYDKTTGIAADSETWEVNAAAAAQDDDSDDWVITVPTLPKGKRIAVYGCDAASPTETDVRVFKSYYDPETRAFYDPGLPVSRGRLLTR